MLFRLCPIKKAKIMIQARDTLLSIISYLKMLDRLGIAIRDHEDFDLNFCQLVQRRSGDGKALGDWLKRKDKFKDFQGNSRKIQNEMMVFKMIAFEVLRQQNCLSDDGRNCGYYITEQKGIRVKYVA